jgi:alpha-ribazole phosphatase
MRILLVRHPYLLIKHGTCYGRLDVPIHPTAQSDIEELATAGTLATSRRVWTSPARRCDVQAEIIARCLAIPKTIDERLQELDFGAWEGMAWNDIPRPDLDKWAADPEGFRPPDGESGAELVARCRSFHSEVSHVGEDCTIVSHGGPLVVLQALFTGKPIDLLGFKLPTGSIYTIERAVVATAPA